LQLLPLLGGEVVNMAVQRSEVASLRALAKLRIVGEGEMDA